MATSAAKNKSRPTSGSGAKSSLPKRWWQQILLYPAFAVALVTAGPQWIDKLKGMRLGVKSAADSEKQAALWAKNASCAGMPAKGFLSPRNVAVDATICDSGDILVRAVTPQNAEIFKWLPLDDVVRTAGQGGLVPSAQAATLSLRAQPAVGSTRPRMIQVALLQTVLCTRMDGRFLHRRVSTPQGCFDEVIDTYTGALVSRNSVPCTPQC
jgi:hypothetical protein